MMRLEYERLAATSRLDRRISIEHGETDQQNLKAVWIVQGLVEPGVDIRIRSFNVL